MNNTRYFGVARDLLCKQLRMLNSLMIHDHWNINLDDLGGIDLMNTTLSRLFISCALVLGMAGTSHAISITAGGTAASLAGTVTSGSTGIVVTGSSLSGHTTGGTSFGTYTNASGTYGIGPGIVLSSGDVADYSDGPNTSPSNTTSYGVAATAAQELLLDPITGGSLNHNDVTQLDITFDMLPGFDTAFFNVVFGSDEFDEFVGSSFIDAFGLYLNGTNIASTAGFPINIDHPDMTFLGGTELDGILVPDGGIPITFSGGVLSTGNTLTIILADSGDSSLDSTVYVSALGGTPPPAIPEPATVLLFGSGLVGLAAWRRFKKNA